MVDFLRYLLVRSREPESGSEQPSAGRTGIVRPRPVARFENDDLLALVGDEVVPVESDQGEPLLAPRQPRGVSEASPPLSTIVAPERTLIVSEPAQDPAQSVSVPTQDPAATPDKSTAEAEPPLIAEPRPATRTVEDWPPLSRERPEAPTDPPRVQVPSVRTPDPSPSQPTVLPRQAMEPEAVPEPVRPAESALPPDVQIMVAPLEVRPQASLPVRPRFDPLQQEPDSTPAEKTVQVTIGRIEVRVEQPAKQAPASPPPRPRRPAISLAEYLEKRAAKGTSL